MTVPVDVKSHPGPAGGWGSAKSLVEVLHRERIVLKGLSAQIYQNKPSGFACVSCLFTKSGNPKVFEFCDNGAKASRAAIACYGMGITQHRTGVENVQMLSNLLLLRGNIGKPGAGICPVRGHSNVQGQRAVGITEKPDLVPNDRLKRQYGFEPPLNPGMKTVEVCEGVLGGKVAAFIGLGGNFIRAVPETEAIFLRHSSWLLRRLFSRVQPALTRLAPRNSKQGACGESNSCSY